MLADTRVFSSGASTRRWYVVIDGKVAETADGRHRRWASREAAERWLRKAQGSV